MPDDADNRSQKVWSFLMSWIGRNTAIVGLCATIAGGVTWLTKHRQQQREHAAQVALAEAQTAQADYPAAIITWGNILKSDPLNAEALDGQLRSAMLWSEQFSVLAPEGQSPAESAGRALDEIFPILQSGLTRSKGTRAADVQAHLGWAHWLNQHIAEREFGSEAERNFRAALTTDPANVFANAMLGNWLLQNGRSLPEAIQHFDAAVATHKERPLVRRLQIGGLTGLTAEAVRPEIMHVANDMRIGGEPLEPREKERVFNLCCNVALTSHEELVHALSALPPDAAWKTYLWLDDRGSEGSADPLVPLTHEFVQANLTELSGQRVQALHQYRDLQQKLHRYPGAVLSDAVNAAVTRLKGEHAAS